jgi:enolase-phosphatase E1
VKWLLFDVEGTITALAFVKDELFPYARAHVRAFLEEQATRPEIAALVARLVSAQGVRSGDYDRLTQGLITWMDEDRKQPDLKALQGFIWADGYRTGALRGHLYPDVVPFWRAARQRGIQLAIYSSGSVQAQQLLLSHSIEGDVASLIERHFDTRIGAKGDSTSYRRIAAELGVSAEQVQFFSDVLEELHAARLAGLRTCRVRRPGVPALSHGHPEIQSMTEVDFTHLLGMGKAGPHSDSVDVH